MIETNDMRKFSIDEWYSIFKDVTIQTIIFTIGPDLLKALQQDTWDTNVGEVCPTEYVNNIKEAICAFNNEVFVKNNWHAPLDAKFMSFGNTLKATSIDDVITYLNASDIIMDDYNIKDINFCIALRPWMNIHPASEFRCLVINNCLRGITSRDWLTYYPHFHDEGPNIIRALKKFFDNNIKGKFPLKNYTFDVVMVQENETLLIDFGPLNLKTKLYAFHWDEIASLMKKNSDEEVAPVFRYIESSVGIVPTYLKQKVQRV